MKKILFFYALAFLPLFVDAQQDFYFKCTYKKPWIPDLYVVPNDNIFDIFNYVKLIKDTDSSAHITLKPSQISFCKIGFDAILVSPGDKTEGNFDGSYFQPTDSNSINFVLTSITRDFSRIVNIYRVGDDFNKFKSVIKLLTKYIDSTKPTLSKNIHPWLNENVSIALKEYLSMKMAHFLVLPILFKSPYNEKELSAFIRKNIQIRYPEYWLQLESARIFLQTYYRKISLPNANFNLQKSLEDKYFAFQPIHKLVTYNYFLECIAKGLVKSRSQLLDDWMQVDSKLALSTKEQEEMQDVRKQIQKLGQNISDEFATLPLINTDGKMLNDQQKKMLISAKNIILDYWASWCAPCREKMSKLNSDEVMIDNQKYRIIYISLDEDQAKWKAGGFPFLNKNNSFRITDGDNPFVHQFDINRIPRYMLINESALISAEFSF
ncbi:MAG: thioredoxin-like domain-containing protein [Ginsengibacter sp.]